MSNQFDVPVVLVIFKRPEKSVQIVSQIAKVRPRKLYIVSDAGRTTEENQIVSECRHAVEEVINWDCEVVKDYAVETKEYMTGLG